ncbi:hypothetical protein [Bacillus sp. SA1-12]|uniref:hypothetical protein n=1 Tax=Bacillus sp. SA1-12 TaxID=1455638 RepID=UPI000695ECA9|nr:hypothetical protein [Bacillus sp. SA1-12]
MQLNKRIVIACIIGIFLAGFGWYRWSSLNESTILNLINDAGKDKQASEDLGKVAVNEPVPEDMVVFSTAKFANGHDFIKEFHNFYNDTLCWGRVDTANYKNQQEIAMRIVEAFKGLKVNDSKLHEDFVTIESTAKLVVQSDDREAMVKLHRLFHDLDIFFNGYSQDHAFGVTQFKGI